MAPYRTLLEQLLHESDYTFEEWVGKFAELATNLGEDAPLVVRTLQRWASGRTRSARPANRRVAAQLWGHPFSQLVADRSTLAPARRAILGASLGCALAVAAAELELVVAATPSGLQQRFALGLLGHPRLAAGAVAFDRLELTSARRHLLAAQQIGAEIGNLDLAVHAQVSLGDLDRRQGRYAEALTTLDATEVPAMSTSTTLRVRRHRTIARLHAETGARYEFEQAIELAAATAEALPEDHVRDGDDNPAGVRREHGHGLTLLGHPDRALHLYDLAGPPSSGSDRDRNEFVLIRAQALAHGGHLPDGVALAIEALHQARSYGSARHVSRVRRMHDRLATQYGHHEPALRYLRDALAA